MVRPRWKRKSGWVTPVSTLKIKKKVIFEEALEPRKFYDEWINYRDGMRFSRDKTRIRSKFSLMGEKVEKFNKKIRKLICRRKARKLSMRNLVTNK